MNEGISSGALARLFDVTERRIQQLAADGVIPKIKRDKYPLIESVQGYTAFLRKQDEGKGDKDEEDKKLRKRLLKAKVRKAELEAGKMADELLTVDEVSAEWGRALSDFRAAALGLPAKMAAEMIAVKEFKEAKDIAEYYIHDILLQLSKYDGDDKSPPADGGVTDGAAPAGQDDGGCVGG